MPSSIVTAIPSSILIFGATGNIGVHLTEHILKASPRFSKIVIFTSPGTATSRAKLLAKWQDSGASVITGDLTNAEDVRAAYHGVDTVVSAVGRGALQHQMELLRLAEASSSVQWFFPSEYGTDVEHNAKSAGERPHQGKLAVRKFVREEIKRLRVVYLVTGPFFDMWTRFNYDKTKKEAQVIDDGEGKIGFCTMPDVGKFLVAALESPPAISPRALRVHSFVVTPNQVLAEYEKQTGSKWKVVSAPLAEFRAMEEKMWEQNHPIATPMTLRRIWAEGGTLYDKNDNEMLGMTEDRLETLEAAVKRDLKAAKM